jgi:cobalt-zinc-cadmium efflux system protein
VSVISHSSETHASAGARRLLIVLVLVTTFLVVEVIGGLLTNSLALWADAGHMATDSAGLLLALLAIWFARRPATPERSYGYARVEIFAAAINAVILLGVAAIILVEAVQRLAEPPEVVGLPVLLIAGIGLVVNLVGLRLLHAGAQLSLNLRGAYLEVLGDLFGSVAVIVAGLVIVLTGWTPIDPIASILIALAIVPRTWSLLREVIEVLLQATPRGIDLAEVRAHLLGARGVVDIHDLHAWTLTSGKLVVSAHVVIEPDADPPAVLDELCACLTDDFDFEHSTIQLESVDRRRLEQGGHP